MNAEHSVALIHTITGMGTGRRRRPSDYALQLQEKQKVRAIYGVSETQFRRFYARAAARPGETGANLLQYLERRLDNVVYLLGFARSRPMARQLVNHGHVQVNGRRVDIASFQVESGQTVTLTEAAQRIPGVVDSLAAGRPVPRWLERGEQGGRVLALPERSDVSFPIDELAIVALYAR
jgi:small subunit ribosomal protein S4